MKNDKKRTQDSKNVITTVASQNRKRTASAFSNKQRKNTRNQTELQSENHDTSIFRFSLF